MSAGSCLPQPKSPEWLHTGRYLLIALALHGLVLLYPLTLGIDLLETTPPAPVQVRLTDSVLPVQAIPPATPEKPATQKSPLREKPVQTPQPVIALAQVPISAPAIFAVPAPIAAPPVPPPASIPTTTTAQAAVIAARFDAAYLNNPHPEYPPISRRLGEEGKVLLKVRVTPDGRVAAVDVEKSSNFARLDDAALRSVTRWRFVPAKRGDEAIEATVIVPIVFRLDN
jgi:protein TonB